MNLPDFRYFNELNRLRQQMGIAEDVFGSLQVLIDPSRLTEIELERLTSPDGLDIESLDDVRVLNDGTIAYKNSRVLLYIRDHNVYGSRPIDPKFHVANCDTLQEMKRKSRFARYVVATRLDGTFWVNLIDGTAKVRESRKLSVCQNCLNILHFEGFIMGWPRSSRLEAVKSFTVEGFFEKYPRSLHSEMPEHDSDSAPLNDYNQDFSVKSNALRAQANWTCQNKTCGLWLGSPSHRKFLHVHHLNGVKSDDTNINHRVLCIRCHAAEPHHGHMKGLPDYQQFVSLKI